MVQEQYDRLIGGQQGSTSKAVVVREQYDRLMAGTRLVHSRLLVRCPRRAKRFDRLISGYRLI